MAMKIIAILLVAVLGAVKAAYGGGLDQGWSISAVAYGPFTAGLCAVFYLIGKLYCIRWYQLRGGGAIYIFLDLLFVPAIHDSCPLF